VKKILRIKDVAARLDICLPLAYKLISEGRIASIKCGRIIRVPESALQQFMSGGGHAAVESGADPKEAA